MISQFFIDVQEEQSKGELTPLLIYLFFSLNLTKIEMITENSYLTKG
jgi:hypothetical protein